MPTTLCITANIESINEVIKVTIVTKLQDRD